MTLSDYRALRDAEARRVITDPALCRARPQLQALAWCYLKKRQGHPILRVVPGTRRLGLHDGASA